MGLESLNSAQREAVMHGAGPMIILAGAGTGKTRVITERMKHLIERGEAKSSEILALTFTEKAASEMVERLDVSMPLGYEEIAVKTFHGFCERVLRERGHEIGLDTSFSILSKMKQWSFLRRNIFRFPLKYYRPLGNPAKYLSLFMGHFDRLKDEYISPDEFMEYSEKELKKFEGWNGNEDGEAHSLRSRVADYENAVKQHEMALLYCAYQQAMASEGFMDFGDLVFYTLKLFETRPSVLREYSEQYRFIMVDEFQDTNYVQTRLALLLARTHGNIVVVGDDDQSIYRWRGASLSNIMQFQREYPECRRVVLNENYRSRQEILDSAYRLIQGNNPNRLEVSESLGKKLVARRKFGVCKNDKGEENFSEKNFPVELRVFDTYLDEVGTIAQDIVRGVTKDGRSFRDYAILARTNSHLKAYAQELLAAQVPFSIRASEGVLSFDEVKDLIAVARVLVDPYDSIAMYRVLSIPAFGIDVQEIFVLLKDAKTEHVSLFELLRARKNQSQSALFDATGGAMKVLEVFEELMEYSARHKPSSIFIKFLDLSGYLKRIIDMDNGDGVRKLANINSFAKLVTDFEKDERKNSLFDLLNYLDVIDKSELPQDSEEIDRDEDAVQLLTGHSAKGLEFPIVYIVSLVQNRFPGIKKSDPFEVPRALLKDVVPDEASHIEEERRLMYVAMTRAQEQLICTYSRTYEGAKKWKPSIFLSEIFENCEKSTREFDAIRSASIKPSDEGVIISLPKNLKINLNQMSYTQFDTFMQCPLKYSYRYLMAVPTPPSHASSYGTAIHATLNEFYQEISSGTAPSLENLLSLFEKNWIHEGFDDRGHEEKRKSEGREVLKKFFEVNSVPEWVIPAFLEKPFSLKIGEARIGGRIDRIDKLEDGTYEVIDYKTGSSKKDTDLQKDLQLSLYDIACREGLGIHVSKLSLYFIDDNVKVSTSRTDEQLEACRHEILELVEEMKKSDFAPTPGFVCKFCDFRLICSAQ